MANPASHADAALLDAWTLRDEGAFQTLIERHGRLVLAACQRLAPPGEADDCAQATFLVLARRPTAARRSPALEAWLLRTAWNICRRAQRNRARRRRAESAWRPEPTRMDSDSGTDVLTACLTRLSERQRLAVLRHHLHGHSAEEIGRDLGLSANATRQLIHRGVSRLRQMTASHSDVGAVLGLLAHESARLPAPAYASVLPPTHPAATLAAGTLRDVTMAKLLLIASLLLIPLSGTVVWLAAAEDPHDYHMVLTAPASGGYTGYPLKKCLADAGLPIRLAEPALEAITINVMTRNTTIGQWWATLAATHGLEARLTREGLLLARPGISGEGVLLTAELTRLGLRGIPTNGAKTRLDLVSGGVVIDAPTTKDLWLIDATQGRVARYHEERLVAWWQCSSKRLGDILVLQATPSVRGPETSFKPDSFLLHPDPLELWMIGNADGARWWGQWGRILVPAETDAPDQLAALRAGHPAERWNEVVPPSSGEPSASTGSF